MSEEALEEIKYYSEMYPDGIHKKSQAEEMFKELGYKLFIKSNSEICYMEKENTWYIKFYLDEKVVLCSENDFYTTSIAISVEELQAINKQVEELGWKAV